MMIPKMFPILYLAIMLLPCSKSAFAENIDPGKDDSKYAWGENVGWINFRPSFGPGVVVSDTGITGYAWGENVGWINLSPAQGGVINDGIGNLSGYAWGENVGWISFSCVNTTTCATFSYGVTINPETGKFSGKAWGQNVGWISFDSQLQVKYMIVTSWRGQITISGRVVVNIAGHTDLSVTNATVSLKGTPYTTTTDRDGEFTMKGVKPGSYTLVVTAPDLVPIREEIALSEGQQLETSLPPMAVLNQDDLDRAVAEALAYWDFNADGKMGLEEAIRALQVLSGVRSE
jgi:hypothetical protein